MGEDSGGSFKIGSDLVVSAGPIGSGLGPLLATAGPVGKARGPGGGAFAGLSATGRGPETEVLTGFSATGRGARGVAPGGDGSGLGEVTAPQTFPLGAAGVTGVT